MRLQKVRSRKLPLCGGDGDEYVGERTESDLSPEAAHVVIQRLVVLLVVASMHLYTHEVSQGVADDLPIPRRSLRISSQYICRNTHPLTAHLFFRVASIHIVNDIFLGYTARRRYLSYCNKPLTISLLLHVVDDIRCRCCAQAKH